MSINSFRSKRNDAESVKHKRVICEDKSKYMCACGIEYDYESGFNDHIESTTMSYTCPHCSEVIISSRNFKKHLDSNVCRKDISDDDKELILGNNRSSSSNISSHKSQSRTPPVPSNEKGIVIIISL